MNPRASERLLDASSKGQQSRELTGFLGVFTQTLLPSPVTQWILPARLRNRNHNDVVFVGQRRVQIKQATVGGFLEDVLEKTDFTGSIVGAKVLNVSTQLPWESQLQTRDPSARNYITPEVLEMLPSQILVLSLEMKQLVFLCCSPSSPGEFITYRRPLPIDVNLPEKFGKHIAVDPKSRAIAISASSNYFGFLRLKSSREIQLQLAQDRLDPIQKETFYRCEGIIMFMEFLYPKSVTDKQIILLIILVRSGVTYGSVYEWQEDQDHAIDPPQHFEFKLPRPDRMPAMIAPLTKESSFLVITTTGMAVYSVNNYVRPARYPLIAPSKEVAEAPLWTRWARPARNWLYSQKYDGIYLCREDGWTYYLEFSNEGELELTTSLGQLHFHVDLAFDVLDMGHEGGDFIMAAGSMGDGGLYKLEARKPPICEQRFLNWAPVTDAVMIRSDAQSTPRQQVSRDRLFFTGIRNLWAITDDLNGGVYILITDPVFTLLLYLTPEGDIGALDESETGLDTTETLATGCTPEGVIVQVTENATHLFVPPNLALNSRLPHKAGTSILAVDVDGPNSSMVTALRRNGILSLSFAKVIVKDDEVYPEVGPALNIEFEPICLSLEKFGDMMFVFVGSGCGTLRVFRVENGLITFFCQTTVNVGDSDDISRAIDSLAAIRVTLDGTLHAFLLCGLRSGILVPFQVDFEGSSLITLVQQEPKRIGTTSLRVQSKDTFALLVCGDELWRVTYPLDGPPWGCILHRVWITEQNNPAYFPIKLYGCGLLSSQASALGNLFCFADGELLICHLYKGPKMIPRRIGLPGTATKMTYSEHLRRLLVSYSISNVEDPSAPNHVTTRSYIECVDPDSQHAVVHWEDSNPMNPGNPQSAPGETISSILDWSFEKNGHKYHLIVLGTSLPALDAEGAQGRVIIMNANRDPSDPSRRKFTTKYVHDVSGPDYGPVRAIAPFRDSLIVGAGKMIFPVTARSAETRWVRDTSKKLPSAAVAITVYGSFVFVTTARHGFMIFEVIDGTLKTREWDDMQRDGIAHYICPGRTPLAFMASRGGGVRVSKLGKDPDGMGSVSHPAEIRLSDTIIRFVLDSMNELTPMTPWQRGSSMFGFALNGAVYRFSLLRKNELQLLWLLQNMCLRDPVLCPSALPRERRTNSLWGEAHGNNRHIDGDILARLAQHDPGYLEQMILRLDTARKAEFFGSHVRELAQEVLGESWNYDRYIVHWLRTLLQVQF
ncbi:uncharacterized protein N7477_003915 [Penicillium maclennaniae]|uniref:uncharacterized protein n=1 Tax=Penicillium maclennaniae TaxID=1343394 RepID=UPI00253FD91D|nr:uncharacterized protein N7477_003915 [Penicillium maclennaniae]KAJ5678282.1 hypothetical protein N7477_003915 [Penicillium maclennaniae]